MSIGINLNPDAACNFDCVYCQVDRTGQPRVREVRLDRLIAELEAMIIAAKSGELFEDPAFHDVPQSLRDIQDIAFSGDGEPTTCRDFAECVGIAADLKKKKNLKEAKIVLITDACYLTRPQVEVGLAIMDENNGEIWAKLDAGTEEYYQSVNRPNFPLNHVVQNIIATARTRSIVIQSIFMRLSDTSPPLDELIAYTDRLNEVVRDGGRIKLVQVYTVARPPAESYVSPLRNDEVNAIATLVRDRTGLSVRTFYGG